MNPRLLLLTFCQGLFLTNNVTFIAINGLVGLALAPTAWMATLPITGYVAGGALCAGLVARHQRAWGRRRAFQAGLVVAMLSSALCAYAAVSHQFWLLVAATLMAGYYNANAGLYRFAATEIVAPAFKERAISWVLAGGILGAVAGPNLASVTRDALPVPFAGAYAALVVVALLALLTISFIEFPPLPKPSAAAPGRPLREIARQPVFIVAVTACALGYGVMNLLMAATPIAMAACSHPFGNTALVLEWHVLGMFVPSFFTGSLIKRVGCLPVMAAGVALNVLCIAIALAGVDLMHFTVALLTLGVGWNFLFIGGTTLFTQAYRPEEKTTAQAAMDTLIFTTMTLTSFSSGALVTTSGWTLLNLGSIVPVAIAGLAIAWLALQRRGAQNQVST
ncbi:MFS transporter [Rhizobacter sp. Root404]|uniref:MFS transporter n=1 Tax=Rhizobacter sp. Root404 TaxID=1736528 RepID=UPI0006F31423|nr:MFS transporter [Rhizobacter sp. Root404]KQW39003.1 MFS transporter [Rhizobacter sp. Root404]